MFGSGTRAARKRIPGGFTAAAAVASLLAMAMDSDAPAALSDAALLSFTASVVGALLSNVLEGPPVVFDTNTLTLAFVRAEGATGVANTRMGPLWIESGGRDALYRMYQYVE